VRVRLCHVRFALPRPDFHRLDRTSLALFGGNHLPKMMSRIGLFFSKLAALVDGLLDARPNILTFGNLDENAFQLDCEMTVMFLH
jgi:hypothetical protein